MNKFTRINSGASRPKASESRVFGEKVTMGEPLRLQGDADMRNQVESSLEIIARERLLEAEDEATRLLAAARAEAARLLEKANAQAKELLETARQSETAIREAAHEEGFKTGFQEGYADATDQVAQETIELLQGAQVLVEGAYQAERRVLKDFEKHAVQLIAHVIRRILKRELAETPELLLPLVRQSVESLYLSGKVKVVVSSQVIQDLRQFSAKSDEALDAMRRFEFIADPGLNPDQIYIVGQDGSFDISPDAQVDQLLSPVKKHLALPRDVEEQKVGIEEQCINNSGSDEIRHCEERSDVAISRPGANQADIDGSVSPGEIAASPPAPRNDGIDAEDLTDDPEPETEA